MKHIDRLKRMWVVTTNREYFDLNIKNKTEYAEPTARDMIILFVESQ